MEINDNVRDMVNKDGDDEDSSIVVCYIAFSADLSMHILGLRVQSKRSLGWRSLCLLNGSDVFS